MVAFDVFAKMAAVTTRSIFPIGLSDSDKEDIPHGVRPETMRQARLPQPRSRAVHNFLHSPFDDTIGLRAAGGGSVVDNALVAHCGASCKTVFGVCVCVRARLTAYCRHTQLMDWL